MLDPVTGVADVIDNQLLFAAAVHPQLVPVVTVIEPVDTVAGTDADVADSTGEHGAAAAAWVIVTVCSAMVRVPVRCVVEVLVAAAKATVPFPVIGVADVIDNQLLFAVADQSQAAPAVTVIVPFDAAAATDAELADSTGPHGMALAPAWVIVTVCPATVSVPVRCVVSGLAVAAKTTVLVPVIGVSVVIDNQLLFAAAAHSQVVPAVTEIDPLAAAAASDTVFADSPGAHGAELANVFDNVLAADPPGPTAHTRA